MNFDLTHEQRMLVQTIRDFIVAELLPLEKEVEESGSLDQEKAREIQQKSMKLGLYALNVPESFGGSATGWTINGKKHFISDGEYSDFFIITAKTDPDAGHQGISTFIIDKETPGLLVGRDQPMMGLRGTSHVELFFDDVKLGPEALLGVEGEGFKLALETLGRVRLAQIGARSVGKATRILDLTVDYARQRSQFGKSIDQFQMIQQMLADSAIEINSARLALLQTAWEADHDRNVSARISMVKVQAAETLCRVADRAVQIYGGLGYCRDLPIERYYRDARIYRIYDGTSEIHRMVVARAISKGDLNLYNLNFAS
jgi:acyl-CoA dehydrogenase